MSEGIGEPILYPEPSNTPFMATLSRNKNSKIIGGVCSGLARYLGWDTTLVRIVFLVLLFGFGTGLLAYIILWIVMPAK